MAKPLLFVLAIIICSCARTSNCAKILLVFPFPSKSHKILGDGFVRILVNAGHEVTYITPYPKEDTPSLRYIDVSANEILKISETADLKAIIEDKINPVDKEMLKKFINLINTTFSSKQLQELMNNPNEKFDLTIVDFHVIYSQMYAGLATVFDCPYIWFSSLTPHGLALSLIDDGLNPSFNPNIISLNIPPFTFYQRLQELFIQVLFAVIKAVYVNPTDEQYYYDVFVPVLEKKGRQLPSFEELTQNASLMFGNSDVSTGRAMSLPDNYKHIAGYHIDPEVKPLHKDLKNILDNSESGVIYFSLGSIVRAKDFPEEIKQSLLKMFGNLKYTVLWKFEEKMTGVPKNVHILHWAPQPSILSHPKCKLFITHGGLLSTIETIHFGVPIIGIPVFGDQFINVGVAVKKGYALKVDLSYKMADEIKVAIEEILGNPKYKQTIDELNFIFHDRPVNPDAEVVHWVNHVIRTKGAPHLRSVALMVPWYQKYYVDFLVLVLVILYITVKTIKRLCHLRNKIVSKKKYN